MAKEQTITAESMDSPSKVGRLGKRLKRITGREFMTLLVILVLLLAGIFFAYKYNQAQNKTKLLSDPQQSAKQQVIDIETAVGKLVQLPANETPTLATVSDASKLKSQPFFAKAENGDKVLIYTQSKKAILYRPSTNKIIEIAPVNIGDNTTNNQPAAGQ